MSTIAGSPSTVAHSLLLLRAQCASTAIRLARTIGSIRSIKIYEMTTYAFDILVRLGFVVMFPFLRRQLAIEVGGGTILPFGYLGPRAKRDQCTYPGDVASCKSMNMITTPASIQIRSQKRVRSLIRRRNRKMASGRLSGSRINCAINCTSGPKAHAVATGNTQLRQWPGG
jgi:hypothetical protein